jgi:hypothetical protein
VEIEDLDLLRRLDAGAHLAHVLELPALGRPGEVERVAERGEVRLADEGGDQRHPQQHDQPRHVDQQADGEADHRDRVLELAEEQPHQVHPAHRLPARPVEPVLELRVLEVLEIERCRVLHKPHAGGVGEELRERAVGVADRAAEEVGEDRQPELERQQQGQPLEHPGAPRPEQADLADPGRDQLHRLVDDQLADVEHQHRLQRPQQAQAEARQRQRPAGRPDLAQERRQVAQRGEALAKAGVGKRRRRGTALGGCRSDRAAGHARSVGHAAHSAAIETIHSAAPKPFNGVEVTAKWRRVELAARPASQRHFLDLSDLLDHPKPAEVEARGDFSSPGF